MICPFLRRECVKSNIETGANCVFWSVEWDGCLIKIVMKKLAEEYGAE